MKADSFEEGVPMSIRRMAAALVAGFLLTAVFALPAAAKSAPVTKITFKLDSHQVAAGDDVTSAVFVQTRSGNQWVAFPGAVLTIKVDGLDVGTTTSAADGLAPVSYTAVEAGDHVMKVVFAGDDTHKKAQRAQGFEVSAPAPVATAPDAPVLSATAGTALVSLSWTVPADGGSAITSYNVYRGDTTGTETLLISALTGTTYDDTTAVTGSTYYYVVTAVNAVGESAWSNEASATAL
jgi:predicted phage tail protein